MGRLSSGGRAVNPNCSLIWLLLYLKSVFIASSDAATLTNSFCYPLWPLSPPWPPRGEPPCSRYPCRTRVFTGLVWHQHTAWWWVNHIIVEFEIILDTEQVLHPAMSERSLSVCVCLRGEAWSSLCAWMAPLGLQPHPIAQLNLPDSRGGGPSEAA